MQWLIKLKEMKKSAGKTSKEISEATGIPKSTIDKLFSGQTKEPYLSSVKAVVHFLGYTLDDLDDTQTKKAPTEHGESDLEKERLIQNYDNMNQVGREKLVDYSDYLADDPKHAKNPATILTKKQA